MESSGSEAGSEIGRANDSHYDSSPSATRPVSTEPTACNLQRLSLIPADKTTEQRTHREGERSPSHGSSTLANGPPAVTGTVPPPLCTIIKPDPEDSPVATASGKRTLTPPPLPASREDAGNSGEEEDSFCNGEAINIADLVDTVISEEMQLAKDRCRRQPLIQVRTDIVDVGGAMRGNNSCSSSSSAFSVVASAADRGLDLTWPAAAASRTQSASSSSSSPDSQLNGEKQQQAAILLRYPGGPPEGRHLYLPAAANQSFNRQIGVATNGSPRHINGSQSPSGVDSMLNGGLGSSGGRIPPPLIR
jgi:hypothetical protein